MARRSGALLGWAWVYEDGDGERTARVQSVYVPREARRLEIGYYDLLPPTAEEFDLITGLYRKAAEEAGAAGYRTMRWSGSESEPDGRTATLLNAQERGEVARSWSAEPTTCQAPSQLPEVNVQLARGRALTVKNADAEVTVTFLGRVAYVNAGEAIHHQNADPPVLAALIAELVTCLSRDFPHVTELIVWEFEEENDVVRQALALAGMRITARSMEYELSLAHS